MRQSFFTAAFAFAALVAASTDRADAGMLKLTLDEGNYGAAVPSGSGPWLMATFTDNLDGTVGLKLESALNGASEFFKAIGFNYSGPAALSVIGADPNMGFTLNPKSLAGQVGKFTFGFEPQTASGPGRFDGDDVVDLILSSSGGPINVNMFNVTNSEGFYAAAHVNGIGTKSGKIGDSTSQATVEPAPRSPVPEPASLALLAVGSIGIGGFGLRRRQAKNA